MIQKTWEEACENMIVISDFFKICLRIAKKKKKKSIILQLRKSLNFWKPYNSQKPALEKH